MSYEEMNVHKNVKPWDDPWKKKEPDGRLSKKALKDQSLMNKQAAEMKRAATLNVVVECNVGLLVPLGLYKSFTVKVSQPMREKEIMDRMCKAFPELERVGRRG